MRRQRRRCLLRRAFLSAFSVWIALHPALAQPSIWTERRPKPTPPVTNRTHPRLPPSSPSSPAERPLVYLLQDIHGQPDAQAELSQRIAELAAQHADERPILAVEGTAGPFNFKRFRALERRDIVRELARRYFRRGWIGPAAFLGLTQESPTPTVGLEDRAAYIANVRAFQRATAVRTHAERALAAERKDLDRCAQDVLRAALMRFHRDRSAYHGGSLSLGAYLDRLSDHAADRLGPQSALFLRAWRLERSLDPQQAEKERHAALRFIASRLSLAQAARWLDSKNSSPAALHSSLLETAIRMGANPSGLVALRRYADYLELTDRLQPAIVLAELWDAENRAIARLAASAAERAVLDGFRRLRLRERLVALSLLPNEWTAYQSLPGARAERLLRPFEAFYEAASERDMRFLSNLPSVPVAIVLTGGFHTAALDRALRARGVATRVIRPSFSGASPDSPTAHLSVFLKNEWPLARLFAGRSLFLGVPEGIGAVEPQPLTGVDDLFLRDYEALTADLPAPGDSVESPRRPELQRANLESPGWRLQAVIPEAFLFFTPATVAGLVVPALLRERGVASPAAAAAGIVLAWQILRRLEQRFVRWHGRNSLLAPILFGVSSAAYHSTVASLYRWHGRLQITVLSALLAADLWVPLTVAGSAAATVAVTLSALVGGNLFLPMPASFSTPAPFGRMERGFAAVHVMDVGADGLDYQNSFDEMSRLLPVFKALGFGGIYTYGGLFEMGEISHLLHNVHTNGQHILPEGRADVYVEINGYGTRRVSLSDEISIQDRHGSGFSPRHNNRINPKLDPVDAEARFDRFVQEVHEEGLQLITDYVPWWDPGSLTSRNYQRFIHREVSEEEAARWRAVPVDDESRRAYAEELLKRHPDFAVAFVTEEGVERPILVRHLSIAFPHKDQIIPDLYNPEVQDAIVAEITALMDRGVDGIRIDLLHKLLREELAGYRASVGLETPEEEPLRAILTRVKANAASRGREFRIIGETYNAYVPYRDIFESEWRDVVDDVYYENPSRNFEHIMERDSAVQGNPVEHLRSSFEYVIDEGDHALMFPTNFDNPSLADIGNPSRDPDADNPGPRRALVSLMAFIANQGAGFMMDLRDLMDHHGQIIPIVGPYHPVLMMAELEERRERPLAEIVSDSPMAHAIAALPALNGNQKLQVLDTSHQYRYIAVAGKGADGTWPLAIGDLRSGQVPPEQISWVSLPHAFLAEAGYQDAIESEPERLEDRYELVHPLTGAVRRLKVFVDPADQANPVRVQLPWVPRDGFELFVIRKRARKSRSIVGTVMGRMVNAYNGALNQIIKSTAGGTETQGLSDAGDGTQARQARRYANQVMIADVHAGNLTEMEGRLRRPSVDGLPARSVLVASDPNIAERLQRLAGPETAVLQPDEIRNANGDVDPALAMARAFGENGRLAAFSDSLSPETKINLFPPARGWSLPSLTVSLGDRELDLAQLDVRVHFAGRVISLLAQQGDIVYLDRILRSMLEAVRLASRGA